MPRRSPGEGSITQRKDGHWQAALMLDGKRLTVYGRTRSEAAEKLRTLSEQARKNGGRLPTDGKLALGEYMANWLEQAKPRLRPKTWERYELVARLHILPYLGKTTLGKLTPLRLARHYADLSKTCGARTVQITHRLLRKTLGDAHDWGMVACNAAALVDSPQAEPKEPEMWQPDQIASFLRAMAEGRGGQYGSLYAFLLASGCREGEAFGLKWADLDWQAGSVRIERQITFCNNRPLELPPKSKAGRRSLILPEWGLAALRRQRTQQAEQRLKMGESWRGGEHVFTSETGFTPTPSNVRRGFRATCGRLGLPALRVHDLRHLSLSLLAMGGVPVKVAQQRAGHSSPALTLRVYQHVLGDGDRQAAEVLGRALVR